MLFLKLFFFLVSSCSLLTAVAFAGSGSTTNNLDADPSTPAATFVAAPIEVNEILQVRTPSNGPVAIPTPNPSNPLEVFHNIIKRLVTNILRTFRQILNRLEHWVIHTSNNLELLESRNLFGPMFNKLLRRIAGWMRGFVRTESDCVGRVLCELAYQSSGYIPLSVRQATLIYFTTNQDVNQYYQPLANGFVNAQSCSLLYNRCNHQRFYSHLEQFNVTVPDLLLLSRGETETDELDDLEAAESSAVLTQDATATTAAVPVVSTLFGMPMSIQKVPETLTKIVTEAKPKVSIPNI